VGACFDAQRAEGVGGIHLDGRALDAGFFRVAHVEHLHGVVVLLGPAQVHAQQHLGEVGRVDAAGAGTDGDDRRTHVEFAVEQRVHLEVAEHLRDAREFRGGLVSRFLVTLGVGEFHQHLKVVEAGLDAHDAGQLRLAMAQLAGHLLRVVGVVPQIGRTGLFIQVGDIGAESFDIDHRPDVVKRGPQCGDLLREFQLNHVEPQPTGPPGHGIRSWSPLSAPDAAGPDPGKVHADHSVWPRFVHGGMPCPASTNSTEILV